MTVTIIFIVNSGVITIATVTMITVTIITVTIITITTIITIAVMIRNNTYYRVLWQVPC